MLRKLCTLDKWSNLSLLKLRELLARRGLNRVGSREEMTQRLHDASSSEAQDLPDPSPSASSSALSSLSQSFLIQEILKRNPDFLLPAQCSRKHLAETLGHMVCAEKDRGAHRLKSLILRSASNPAEISTEEICQVFEGLAEANSISQYNMNTLINSEAKVMAPIWNLVKERMETLSFTQVSTVLLAVCTLQESFKKNFEENGGKIQAGVIEKLLARANNSENEESASEIARLLHVANVLLKAETVASLPPLQAKMLRRLGEIQELSDSEVSLLLENLPEGSYSTHKAKIDELLVRFQSSLPRISSEKLIAGVFGLHHSECAIPFKLVYSIDSLPKDFLKKLSPDSLFRLSKILGSNQMLSEEIGKTIIDV